MARARAGWPLQVPRKPHPPPTSSSTGKRERVFTFDVPYTVRVRDRL